MSAAEFAGWIAYDRIEPLPDPWLQTGVLAASNANLWRSRKNKPARPLDYVPRLAKPRRRRGPRLTPAEQSALFAALSGRKEC
jgi:hypothetical protein